MKKLSRDTKIILAAVAFAVILGHYHTIRGFVLPDTEVISLWEGSMVGAVYRPHYSDGAFWLLVDAFNDTEYEVSRIHMTLTADGKKLSMWFDCEGRFVGPGEVFRGKRKFMDMKPQDAVIDSIRVRR